MILATRSLFFFVIITTLLQNSAFAESTPVARERALHDNSVVANSAMRDADCVDFINERPQNVTCGFIDLPLNHDAPTKDTISLPILIARQTRAITATGKAILIPGGGGPGAPIGFGLAYGADEYLGIYRSLRAAGFDLIILDQRGAGYAKPALRCPETVAAFEQSLNGHLSFTAAIAIYRSSLQTCRTRLLSENIQITHFDTYQSARDYLAVMESLPYTWWGTLATSYATVIAQHMEVLKPSAFDRIVLDSPVAIDYQQPFTFELTEKALQRILSLCSITRQCDRKHPEIETKFREVLLRSRKKPFTVNISVYDNKNNKQKIAMPVNDTTVLEMLTLAAYSNYSIAEIPWIVHQLYDGNTNALSELATEYWYYNSDLDFSSALSWNIHCKERQAMEKVYLRNHPGLYNELSVNSKIALEQEQLICQDWNTTSGKIPPPNETITTKTLVVAGDLDPVISREDIKNAADNLTNKTVMIMPGTGHSVWFQSSCTRQNVTAFFADEPDTSLRECRDGIRRFK